MKTLTTLATLVLAGPALAHTGAHLHPHGIDAAWIFLAGTVAGGVAVTLLVRARR